MLPFLICVIVIIAIAVIAIVSWIVKERKNAQRVLAIPEPKLSYSEKWASVQKTELMKFMLEKINECQTLNDQLAYQDKLIGWYEGRAKAYQVLHQKVEFENCRHNAAQLRQKETKLEEKKDGILAQFNAIAPQNSTLVKDKDLLMFARQNNGTLCYLLHNPRGVRTHSGRWIYFVGNIVVVQDGRNIRIESYANLVVNESYMMERLGFSETLSSGDEIAGHYWLHEKKRGGPDRRFSYNPMSFVVYRGILEISLDSKTTASLKFSNRIKAHAAFQQLKGLIYDLSLTGNRRIYAKMLSCDRFLAIAEIKAQIEKEKQIELERKAKEEQEQREAGQRQIEERRKAEEQKEQAQLQKEEEQKQSFNGAVQNRQKEENTDNREVFNIEKDLTSNVENSGMKSQPKWDKYETALLIEAYLKVKNGASRSEIISDLSQKLRRLAVLRGQQIDDTYRNINGIQWQLGFIEKAMNPAIYEPRKPSQIFTDIVNLCKNNRKDFDLLLQEAHRLCGDESKEGEQKVGSDSKLLTTETVSPKHEDVKASKSEDGVVDFENIGYFAYTKPVLVSYFGEIDTNISSWRDVFKSVLKSLLDDYPKVIRPLADLSIYTYLTRRVETLRRPLFIEDGVYAEGNQNATEIVRHIGQLLDLCYVDYENVIIRYVPLEEEENLEETNVGKKAEPVVIVLSETDQRLYEIIKENYKSGFLAGAINYKKIKRYYEEKYSEELPLTNEEIKVSLDKTCLNVEGKYYAAASLMEDELKERVQAFIEEGITSNGYVYYRNIIEQFGYELTAKIPDEKLLKKYLEKEFAQYTFFDDYIAKDKSVKVDPTREVEAVLLEAVYPVSVEVIKARLPHLTDEAVQKAITFDSNILTTNNNERFHIDSMGLTDDDLQEIKKIITEALEQHPYMFGNELLEGLRIKYTSLYDRIKDFGDRGIRNAVALKLKGAFTFNRNIICPIGADIDNAEVFKSFAESEKYFTLSSLIKLQEQIGVGNVYFDAVNEVAARINQTDYVPNGALSFDKNAIDSVMEQFVPNAICSIKQASNFAVYPSTCYPWTEYLLESYVAKFSEKFKLFHIGYTEGKCVGAIVKKSSQINSFDDVVVEYLINNEAIQTAADALDGLVKDGYIARKRYKGIDELLVIAKAKRKE